MEQLCFSSAFCLLAVRHLLRLLVLLALLAFFLLLLRHRHRLGLRLSLSLRLRLLRLLLLRLRLGLRLLLLRLWLNFLCLLLLLRLLLCLNLCLLLLLRLLLCLLLLLDWRAVLCLEVCLLLVRQSLPAGSCHRNHLLGRRDFIASSSRSLEVEDELLDIVVVGTRSARALLRLVLLSDPRLALLLDSRHSEDRGRRVGESSSHLDSVRVFGGFSRSVFI